MNIKNLVRPNILELQPYLSLRDSRIFDSPVFLDVNENPYGKYNRYPDSRQLRLKEKISEIKKINSSKIALGNGSDELIDLIIKIFCIPGKDSIAVMKPSFSMYDFYAQINENKVIKLDLNENFQLDTAEFLNKTKNSEAKILFLCSPNNPTGNTLENIEFFIQNFNGIIVVDEAYIEFCSKKTIISLLEKYENLIILQTLSKAWGLAGLRIGIAMSSEFIISLINKVKAPYNISEISMKTALLHLQMKEDFDDKLLEILKEKSKLYLQLQKISAIQKIFPSDANFFLIQFNNAERVFEILLQNNILTSKRFPEIKNALRINVGSAEENEKLLTILKTIS